MNKQDYLQYQIENALVESDASISGDGPAGGGGLLLLGNNILRLCIDRLSKSYDFV